MALTTRGDGTGAAFQINSNWFNDFKNALTGVMTDQPYKLNYRPGSGTTPVLILDGDGTGHLLRGLKTDHATTAFSIDSSGNAVFAANVTTNGKFAWSHVTTAGPDIIRVTPTDGHRDLGFFYANGAVAGPDDGFGWYNYTSSATIATLNSDGRLTITGAFTATSGTFSGAASAASFQGPSGVAASFRVYDNAVGTLRNIRIFIGTTDPATYTTVNEGDIWIKA